ncbi:MAG: TIM barrel protein [Clostridia bacterium]|nr:TIM barrel protein [Clostridia bacterium]
MVKTYAFADEASAVIDRQIEAMKRNNLSGLEIRNVDGTNVSDITFEKAAEVRKKLEANGLSVWSVGSPVGKTDINGDFEADIESFKHTLEVAHILNAENIRIFSFYIPQDKAASEFKNEVIDRLGRFSEIAAGSGVTLCHENEKGIYGDTAERCLDILKAVPQIKGIFDPANFVQCGVDTLKAWDMLGEYIKYMHIKDAMPDGSVVPAGCGAGNVKEIVHMYMKNGGTAFTIEPHLAVFDGLAGLEREGEKSNVNKFVYKSNDEAFDAACTAFKNISEVK